VPAYICPAVLTGLSGAGVRPQPIDCEPGSIRFDPDGLSLAVRRQEVDAVLAPNTYGIDQDYSLLATLPVPVIEDAAYQTGRMDQSGRLCGTRGHAGVWSFNFKALAGLGGGVLLVRNARNSRLELQWQTAERSGKTEEAFRFLNYMARSVGRHWIPITFPGAAPPSTGVAVPSRRLLELPERPMSELQAAVALAQWQRRGELAAIHMSNSRRLRSALSRCEAFAPLSQNDPEATCHLFPILLRADLDDARGRVLRVRQILHRRGVQTESPYQIVLGSEEDLPRSHDLASRLILLPMNARLGPNQISVIAGALIDASHQVMSGFKAIVAVA
jgi:dTDP-4-amino-4,6-dideoxygalactose transaminase